MNGENLTPKQEVFCILFASDKEFFGNGTQSYVEAYNVDVNHKGSYASARAAASDLLKKPKVLKRINELLEDGILNDVFIDKQLAFLVSQNAELGTKLGAIKEYNALKQRITKRLDMTSGGEPLIALIEFIGDDETDTKES